MHQFAGAPAGFLITLKSVVWHEVISCGGGFYFAASEAMFPTLRILQVLGAVQPKFLHISAVEVNVIHVCEMPMYLIYFPKCI